MSAREVLQSWKEISAYLGRDIRTCCRWEANLGLPVHRLNGSPKARVLAYKDEIDRWLEMKLHEREAVKPNLRTILKVVLKRWPVVAVFTGVLVVAVLGWRSINNGRPRFLAPGSHPALAVLPFVNSTGDAALDYLCESVPDRLINDLQHDSERLTVFSFNAVAEAVRKIGLEPGKPLTPNDLAAIASRTGAGWFLVGYLTKSGAKLRVNYEVRAAASSNGPSPSGALKTGHVPGAEAEVPVIVDRVADGVRRVFGIPASTGPEVLLACSVQATRFYEMARAIERKYTLDPSSDELERMFDFFVQAREADPGCALAYLGLGDAYQHRFVYEGQDPEAMRSMKENYRRAYAMAPERAETNVGVAWAHFIERDNDQAYAYFKKALEIDPASLHVQLEVGAFLRSLGMLERGAEYFSRVIRGGGSTADVYLLRASCYELMGLYESALADYDKMIELEPLEFRTHCQRARVLVLMKRYDAAAAGLSIAETLKPGAPSIGFVRGLAAAARGERTAALAAVAPERAGTSPALNTYYKSRVYAALGMRDEAIGAIELAIDKGFEDVYDYVYFFPFLNNTRDHFYDRLRGDPRFAEILRREEHKYSDRLERYNGL
jgi:tetratricopeptide (TPR) repeat protein